jgi:hypothetical protein
MLVDTPRPQEVQVEPTRETPPSDVLERPERFAQRIDQSRAQVYKYLAEGMPSLKLGNARRIDPAEALAWLRARSAS